MIYELKEVEHFPVASETPTYPLDACISIAERGKSHPTGQVLK